MWMAYVDRRTTFSSLIFHNVLLMEISKKILFSQTSGSRVCFAVFSLYIHLDAYEGKSQRNARLALGTNYTLPQLLPNNISICILGPVISEGENLN